MHRCGGIGMCKVCSREADLLEATRLHPANPIGHLDDGEDTDWGNTEVAPELEEALYLAECQKAAEAGL